MPKQPSPRPVSLETARRLAVSAQRLDGRRRRQMLDLIRQLGCLQLDPTNAVARNHLLVLWSRLGSYDRGELDRLLWRERALFEYWAHAASIVLAENYPIHAYRMRRWGARDAQWNPRAAAWMEANVTLQRYVLRELRKRGPLKASDFEDRAAVAWSSSGWTGGETVRRMLEFLWSQGKVLVARREGQARLWDLRERVLPPDVVRQRPLNALQATRAAVPISLRALGVATARDIGNHFTPGVFPELDRVVSELERDGEIVRVAPEGLRGTWYVHRADIPRLDRLERGEWKPRATLLSPFDNLIRDRKRNATLWDFGDFKLEIYVPAEKRVFGYFAMPILHGDRLIGTTDPQHDRVRNVLRIHRVRAQPDTPRDAGPDVAAAVHELAAFVGATGVEYGDVPRVWARALRA